MTYNTKNNENSRSFLSIVYAIIISLAYIFLYKYNIFADDEDCHDKWARLGTAILFLGSLAVIPLLSIIAKIIFFRSRKWAFVWVTIFSWIVYIFSLLSSYEIYFFSSLLALPPLWHFFDKRGLLICAIICIISCVLCVNFFKGYLLVSNLWFICLFFVFYAYALFSDIYINKHKLEKQEER